MGEENHVRGFIIPVIIGIILVVALLLIPKLAYNAGFVEGRMSGRERFNKEAVEKGHAEYYLDKEFEKQWRWKNDENKTKN